jgi:lipoate---protein ligase
MASGTDWVVGTLTDGAGALHSAVLPACRSLRMMRPTHPAIVLGSSQDESDVDADFCRGNGIEVVRRRSGGGAVFVHPSDSVWVDIVIPHDDPLWLDDVGQAMVWVGEMWRDVLTAAGMSGLSVHAGPLVGNDWSKTLCFAGVGTGEVMCGDAKVVGISQRRTREGARFQCSAYRRWDPTVMLGALPLLANDRDRLVSLVATVPSGFTAGSLVPALPR